MPDQQPSERVPNADPRRGLKTRAGRRSERSFDLIAVCMIMRERANEINVRSLGNEVLRHLTGSLRKAGQRLS
ncbi:UNVERIFIED_ORG: hypothetical protein ABIC48_001245 [Burkholderia territorii]